MQKIRDIVYSANNITYKIKRILDPEKFLNRALILQSDPTDDYGYMLLNDPTDGMQLELIPASKETSSTNVYIWYLRDVTPIVEDDDIVDFDIPGCINFLYAYVKARCKQKENAGSMPQDAAAEVMQQKDLLISTLTNRVPDNDNMVPMDVSIYEEMS